MIVARRYARALYEQAEQASITDLVDDDMEMIFASLEESDDLSRFFRSPIISRDKKKDVVRALFKERINSMTFEFLEMLIRKQREDIFSRIAQAYRDLRFEQLGIVEAKARSAVDMSASEQNDLEEALGRMTGKDVRLAVTKDPDLIGGVVIRIGDTVFDGSVRHQLERLREKMEVGSISLN